MPQQAWSEKRERQYEHIKEGLLDRGENEDTAEEIAARTVNKERARAGEAKESSRTSTDDISSGRRGGLRSHQGPGGRTRDQLYNEAQREEHQGPLEDEQGRSWSGPSAAEPLSIGGCARIGGFGAGMPRTRPSDGGKPSDQPSLGQALLAPDQRRERVAGGVEAGADRPHVPARGVLELVPRDRHDDGRCRRVVRTLNGHDERAGGCRPTQAHGADHFGRSAADRRGDGVHPRLDRGHVRSPWPRAP